MKKTLLILSLLLTTSVCIKAQSVNWYKVHDQNSNIILSDVVATPDSGVVIAMVNAYYDSFNGTSSSVIVKYDYWGNKQWEKKYFDYAITDLSVLNNQIIVSAYSLILGDVWQYDSLKIFKLNMQGNELISKTFVKDFSGNSRLALHFPKANGTLNLYTDNILWNLNANFDTISTHSISNFVMMNKIEINKGKTFVFGFDRVYIANTNWTVNKTLNLNDLVNSFYLANDTIYAVKNQNIIRIDTNLNVIDSIDFSSTYAEMFKIERQNNTLFIFGYTNNDQILIKQCNLQLALIKDILIDNPLIVNPAGEYLDKCFAVGKNTLYLSSDANNYCLLASISQESAIINIENIDISIEDVSLNIDSTLYQTNPGGTYVSGIYFSTAIVLKNNSSNPINNFKLYSVNKQSNPFFGGPQILIDQVINRTIAPNDTIILRFNKMLAGIYLSYYFEFCVEASLPNGLLDPSFEDNKMCKTETGLGLEENSKLNFLIYPSPAKDYLHIDLKNNAENQSTIEIINVLGTTVEKVNGYGNTNKIDVSKLNEGIYLIRIISNGKLLGTKKFVKQ